MASKVGLGLVSLLLLLLSSLFSPSSSSSAADDVTVAVKGEAAIAATDDSFICATLDWWPSDKCDYGQCPWGSAGILNLVYILNFSFSYFYFLVFLFGNMVYRKVNMCCFVGVLWMWWQDLDNKILSNAIKGKLSFSLVYLFKFFIMFIWF